MGRRLHLHGREHERRSGAVMKLADAKAMLPEIRFVMETASAEWSECYDSTRNVSQIACRDGLTGEVYPIATLEKAIAGDDREIMRKAPVYIRALLMLRDEAVRQYRAAMPAPSTTEASATPAKSRDANRYARACAILSGKANFRQYLRDIHALEAVDDERVNSRVRSILNIQSRNELDTDPQARQRWISLVRDFEIWEKRSRGTASSAPRDRGASP
jgi:hypothetical protein